MSLTKKQEEFITMYERNACNISVTCKKCNISRGTYYLWREKNEEFRQLVEDAEEGLLDMAESKLMININEGKEASIFFFLKTKGKSRGYIEYQELNANITTVKNINKEEAENIIADLENNY